jgi:hypothetical protein
MLPVYRTTNQEQNYTTGITSNQEPSKKGIQGIALTNKNQQRNAVQYTPRFVAPPRAATSP